MNSQTQYPWHEAPAWATHAATDRDGSPMWYDRQPHQHIAGFWDCEGAFKALRIRTPKPLNGDWRDSLEEKP